MGLGGGDKDGEFPGVKMFPVAVVGKSQVWVQERQYEIIFFNTA